MNSLSQSYQPLLRTTVAAAAGIIVDRLCVIPASYWCVGLATTLIGWLLLYRRKHLQSAAILLLLAVASVAGIWHNVHWNLIGARDISTYATLDQRPAVLRATVVAQPKWISPDRQQELYSRFRGIRSRIPVSVFEIRDGQGFRKVTGQLELFVDGKVTDLGSGDQVEFSGNLSLIDSQTNPGQFDAKMFFRRQRTMCWMNIKHAKCLRKVSTVHPVPRAVSTLRSRLDQLIWRYLSSEYAPLASAMLLGNRDQLDRIDRESFLLSGTVHLLAISGLHVGILAGLLLLLPRAGLISRRKSLLLTVVFVLMYAWIVEFRPPVVRAAILISVACYCRWSGRAAFSFNSLAFAALGVLAINPSQLFSPGAQLSFLAVGSLIFAGQWLAVGKVEDPIDRLISRTRPWHEKLLRHTGRKGYLAFAASSFIWLMAIPLVAMQFHVVAPVALLANPLLLIPIAVALISGFAVLVTGWWCIPLATLMGQMCEGSLWIIKTTVTTSKSIPLGHWWTSGPQVPAVIVFYSILIFAILGWEKLRFRYFATGIAIWLVFGWIVPDWQHRIKSRERDSLTCTIIDVGHGGCVLIEFPGGKNVLYDCGSFGSPRNAQQTAAGVLWHQRIRHLDLVVVSHADSDHFNGLPALARQFSIGKVAISDHMQGTAFETPMVASLLNELEGLGIGILTVHQGDQLPIHPEVSVDVLGPPAGGFSSSDNANSIVLDIGFQGHRILLPGDLEKEGLDALFCHTQRKYDLVMAPHHGSKNSRPADFLKWTGADYVVISSGRGKNVDLGIDDPEMTDRKILHTGYDGAVRMRISGQTTQVDSWREDPW